MNESEFRKLKSRKQGDVAFQNVMEAIAREQEKEKIRTKHNGLRVRLLDIYRQKGKNAAVVWLIMYNRKNGTNYKWNETGEKWLVEEKEKQLGEIDNGEYR